MKFWVANTDRRWFEFLAARAPLEEVNFWQPNTVQPIRLPVGAPWLFKFHVRNGGWIVGGGFFAHYTTITPRFAWESFGTGNGAASFEDMVALVRRYAERPLDPDVTFIGSTVIVLMPPGPQRFPERWRPAAAVRLGEPMLG